MEIFGGFMVMISILGFFLAVVWLIMPFVVFTISGKLDRTLDVLAGVEKRLAAIEERLSEQQAPSPIVTDPVVVDPADPNAGDTEITPDL